MQPSAAVVIEAADDPASGVADERARRRGVPPKLGGGLGVNKPPLNGHRARPRSEDKPRTQGRRGTGVRPRRRGLGTGGACADAHAFLRGISLNQAHNHEAVQKLLTDFKSTPAKDRFRFTDTSSSPVTCVAA
ncbi:hypothetical protein HPB52_001464 [Rhipicephalus sanguineus]|uniref:Uncharacterized protein n=1 Tax=Rhipicephalus sanguineus TaxID=34632 RepID=A0A9D4PS40_RHISA|nr:hypothetical protein HPB52_001464 [Rhipicephalus sanguineus]